MFGNATHRLKASHYKYQKINRLKLDVHQDRNREAMKERKAKRKWGKKQRGNEIEDEACDTEKETEKGEELYIDYATFTV